MLKFVLLYQRLFSQQWNAMCIDLLCLLLFSQDFQNNSIKNPTQKYFPEDNKETLKGSSD